MEYSSSNESNEEIGSDKEQRIDESDPLKCRMYERDYPEVNELIMVEVKKIVDMGAYCKLLEYNDLEGMLLMSELQRRRIRSVKRVIKEGRQEIVQVLRVNKRKGYIDLSKKRVTPDQRPAVEDRWNKSKAVHSIMRQIAYMSMHPNDKNKKKNNNNNNKKDNKTIQNGNNNEIKSYTMLELYKLFGWKIASDYGSLYDGFKACMNDFDGFIKKYPSIPNDIHNILKKNIENRLKPKIVTVRAKVEITCFNKEGVNAIKKSLKKGLQCKLDNNDDNNINKDNNNDNNEQKQSHINENDDNGIEEELKLVIKLVAPPLFTVSVNTLDPKNGKILVKKCVDVVKEEIEKYGGELDVKQEAEVIALEI